MSRYTFSLLDRLFDDEPNEINDSEVTGLYFYQLKEAVSRDVENLLNTRSELDIDFKIYPELARSVLTYGLPDFSHMSPNSADDRQHICQLVASIITRFEPRLQQVTVQLGAAASEDSSRDFVFQIDALLMTDPEPEKIVFDAVLEVSTQRYRVTE